MSRLRAFFRQSGNNQKENLMFVDVALRDGEDFEIARIELTVENGVPVYPDCIACSETKRVWRRSTYPSQGKARYDLVRSSWSPNIIKAN